MHCKAKRITPAKQNKEEIMNEYSIHVTGVKVIRRLCAIPDSE